MGNEQIKPQVVKILLDSYTLRPNSEVSGSINIYLRSRFPPSELLLIFKGTEKTRFSVFTNRGATVMLKADRSIIKNTYQVHSWSSAIEPSDLSFQFSFLIPDIPGSFQYEFSDYLALTEYSIKAILKSSECVLKDKQVIHLMHSESYIATPCELLPFKLTNWCCLNKGVVLLKVLWINEFYSKSNPIECVLTADATKSLVDFSCVLVEILFCLQLTTRNATNELVKACVFRKKYPVAVKKGQVLDENCGGKFKFDLDLHLNKKGMINVYSYQSKLIRSWFCVQFSLRPDGCCFGQNPSVSSSFCVKSGEDWTVPAIEIPTGWDPVLYHSNLIEKENNHFKTEPDGTAITNKID